MYDNNNKLTCYCNKAAHAYFVKMATNSSDLYITNVEYMIEDCDEDREDEIVSERSYKRTTDDQETELTEPEDNETTDDVTMQCNASSSSGSTSEFLPLEKAKSHVWKYFGFPAQSGEFIEKDKRLRKEVFCKLCKRSLSYKGNTTNMIVHLQYHHAAAYSELETPMKSKSGFKLSATRLNGQCSIEDSFKKLLPLSRSSSRWKALTNAVCYFLAKDLHPVATVNDPGFQHMLKVFEL